MSTELVPVEHFRQQIEPWPLRAHQLQVTDDSMFSLGGELLRDIKALLQEIDAKCDPVIKAAHNAHKAAVAQKKELSAELQEADRVVRAKMAAFVAERERQQKLLQAAAEAEARKAQESALREAQQLEAAGEAELAEMALAEAASAPAPVAMAPSIAVPGVSHRAKYTAKVVDMRAFLMAVLAGKIPMSAVLPNETLINQQARSLKHDLNWPGVKVTDEATVVVR